MKKTITATTSTTVIAAITATTATTVTTAFTATTAATVTTAITAIDVIDSDVVALSLTSIDISNQVRKRTVFPHLFLLCV